MLKVLLAVASASAMTVSTTNADTAEYDVNPGMWETTYKMEMGGMPPQMAAMMQQPPRIERECVKDKNFDFSPDEMTKDCTFDSTRHSASKVSWTIQCAGDGGHSTGRGEVIFNGDTASGWFEMNVQGGAMGPMKMRNVFTSKRLGAC